MNNKTDINNDMLNTNSPDENFDSLMVKNINNNNNNNNYNNNNNNNNNMEQNIEKNASSAEQNFNNNNLEIDENLIDKNKIIVFKMEEKGNLNKETNEIDNDVDNKINNNDNNKISFSKSNSEKKISIIDNSIYIPDNMNSPKEEEMNIEKLKKSVSNATSINTINDYLSPNTTEDNIMENSVNFDNNINSYTDINVNTNTNTINTNINTITYTNNNNNIIENQEPLPTVENNSEPSLMRSNSLPNLLPSQIYTTFSSEQSSYANTPTASSRDLLLDAKLNPESINLSYSISDASIATLSVPGPEMDQMNKTKYYHEKSKLSESVKMSPNASQTGSVIEDTPNMEAPTSPPITSEKDSKHSRSSEDENLKKDKDGILYPEYYKNPWLFLKSDIYGEDAIPEKLSELKKERVQNFLAVPVELEKFLYYGILICLDSFLYIFTILPIRLVVAVKSMIKGLFVKDAFKLRHKSDILKCLLILFCCIFLQYIDVSRLYHFVRGQNIVKLYLIYNLMENFDKLCSAFGHDVLDSLFAENIIKKSNRGSRFPVIVHFIVALSYLILHTVVLFYLVVSLNVAINSYNNALLSFLISNQFGEIKSSVFKRFERENLFQLTCADIVERFQILVFLVIITGRNFLELTGTGSETLSHFYTLFSKSILSPASFSSMIPKLDILQTFQSSNFPEFCEKIVNLIVSKITNFMNSPTYLLLAVLITPVVVIYGSEIFVDYLKHTFIIKFNQIKPSIYSKYRDSLCKDFAGNKKYSDNQIIDKSGYVSRRIGLVTLPLACLTVRIIMQTLKMFGYLYIDGDHLHSFSIHNFFNNDGTINIKFAKYAFINFFIIFVFFLFFYICVLIFKLYLSLYIHKISYKRVQEMKKEQINEVAVEAQKEEMKRLVKDGPNINYISINN
ncbi:DUF747-domain-containing protein [Neocallimastix californiae]|uniref:DUF747-domain-containing protein n=1 Tax=Neocallimastix californiae TaxID=1754190 RepID=A0A1Y2AQA9_9FUNG|nr:DUF747-domain-containing protein [Neocallimastix californiae]|eukprot:ORY24407.1 DUF747-domain-containing protein [Neocallimastix californiae]